MINLIFTLLVLSAIIASLLSAGFLVLWLRGANLVAFPGLGIIVTAPFVALLLTVLQLILIIAAIFLSRYRTGVDTIAGI